MMLKYGLIALAGFGATRAMAWSPPPVALAQLAKGQAWAEVTPSTDGAVLIHAAVDIAAPAKTVWAVMNDCRFAAKLVVTMTTCRVIQSDPAHNWEIKEEITKGNFIVPTLRNVIRSDYTPHSLIRFHRVGGDLKIEEGEWRLETLNGGAVTRLLYTIRVAVEIPAPAFLVRSGLRKDTAKVMGNIKHESQIYR